MKPDHLERLKRLEGATDAGEAIRERLRQRGTAPDPFDVGEALVIEAIFGAPQE